MTSGVPNNSQRSITQPNNSVSKNNTKNSTERNKGTNADIRKKLTNIIANPTTSNNEIPPSNSSENTIPLLNPPKTALKNKGDQLIDLLNQKKNNPQIKKILKANGGIEGLEADIKAGKGDLDKFLHDIKAYLTIHDSIESWSGRGADRESVFSEQDKLFEGCSDEWKSRAETFVTKFKDENMTKKKALKEFGDSSGWLTPSLSWSGVKNKGVGVVKSMGREIISWTKKAGYIGPAADTANVTLGEIGKTGAAAAGLASGGLAIAGGLGVVLATMQGAHDAKDAHDLGKKININKNTEKNIRDAFDKSKDEIKKIKQLNSILNDINQIVDSLPETQNKQNIQAVLASDDFTTLDQLASNNEEIKSAVDQIKNLKSAIDKIQTGLKSTATNIEGENHSSDAETGQETITSLAVLKESAKTLLKYR